MIVTLTIEENVPGSEGAVVISSQIAWDGIEHGRCDVLDCVVKRMKREIDGRIRDILFGARQAHQYDTPC